MTFVLALAVAFTSRADPQPVRPLSGALEEVCTDLIAEKTRVLGRVCVIEQRDTLFVRFIAGEGWRLTESHVAVATGPDGIPVAGGQHPVLGRFPFKADHAVGVTEYVHAVPLVGALGVAPDVVVAAHASLVRGDEEEGVWAGETRFAEEGNPASYFRFTRSSGLD